MSSGHAASHMPGFTSADILKASALAGASSLGDSSAEAVIVVSSDVPIELLIPSSACSHDGFRKWALSDEFPTHGKLSYIGSAVFIDMSPESFEEQGAIKTEICRVISQIVRANDLGYLRIDRTLISNKKARLSSEPDAVFISREALRSGRVQLVPEVGRPTSSKELVGSVDWVMEIVSPTSQMKDKGILREAYFNAGIPEYWLIDPIVEDHEPVNFQILVAGRSSYVAITPHDGWLASPTFQRSFQLTRERDVDNFWQYTLAVKENS